MFKQVLTIVKPSEVPDYKCYGYFDAVSGEVDNYPPVKELDSRGVERHGWKYLKMLTPSEGRAHGTRMGKACRSLKLHTFYANAELHWSSGSSPYETLQSFTTAFRAFAPSDTLLAFNGFSWSRNSEGRILHDAALIKQFDIWCPMNYGTDANSIARWWERKNFRYKGIKVYPMVGVGRVDKEGKKWGFWETPQGTGLRQLIDKTHDRIDGICYFFGNGARQNMIESFDHHPSLIQVTEYLRKKWDRP